MASTEAAFTISKQVFDGELTQTEGARQLTDNYEINNNSAKIMITVYGKLIQGLEFKRALSAPDMSYYLNRFLSEGGVVYLENPVKALWKHIIYYEEKNGVKLKSLREIYSTYIGIIEGIGSLEDLNDSFHKAVDVAVKAPENERKKRILESSVLPKIKTVVVRVYERNPYVVAEVLDRANGLCEHCEAEAPFIRKRDSSPFLEVHHIIRLADGGEDTVANAIAICPNCHRELHFG